MAWVQHGGVNPKSTKVKHDDDDDDYDYYYYDYDDDDDDDDDDDGEYQCLVMVSGGYPWLMIIGESLKKKWLIVVHAGERWILAAYGAQQILNEGAPW